MGAFTVGWHPWLPLCQRYALSEMAWGQAAGHELAWLPCSSFPRFWKWPAGKELGMSLHGSRAHHSVSLSARCFSRPHHQFQ